MREFADEDIEDVGDLLIDMSESLQDNGYHTIALTLLHKLVHTDKFNQVIYGEGTIAKSMPNISNLI